MKIKKGDWFRCLKYSRYFTKDQYYKVIGDDALCDDDGDFYSIGDGCAIGRFEKLYTIQDLKNSKVAVDNTKKNNKDFDALFDYLGEDLNGYHNYYFYRLGSTFIHFSDDRPDIPTQSVKDFLAKLPKESSKQCANNAHHNDPINPEHYKSYSVETIDMMIAIYGKEKTSIHCELTAFKYRQRLGKKDSLEQDLAKEKWYLEKAKELRNDNSVTKL